MQSQPAPDQPLRILLVDDDASLRATLVLSLERFSHFQVVGQGGSGPEMVELAHQHTPDVIVFSLHLPQLNGFEAFHRIWQERPVAGIALSNDREGDTVRRAIQEQIMAYLAKPFDSHLLAPLIEVAKARFDEMAKLRLDNAKLEKSIENRKLIERAKGVLMRRNHWTEADAFRRLQRTAMNRRTTMADLARQILDGKDVEL
jgi:response regulator NasT